MPSMENRRDESEWLARSERCLTTVAVSTHRESRVSVSRALTCSDAINTSVSQWLLVLHSVARR